MMTRFIAQKSLSGTWLHLAESTAFGLCAFYLFKAIKFKFSLDIIMPLIPFLLWLWWMQRVVSDLMQPKVLLVETDDGFILYRYRWKKIHLTYGEVKRIVLKPDVRYRNSFRAYDPGFSFGRMIITTDSKTYVMTSVENLNMVFTRLVEAYFDREESCEIEKVVTELYGS